VYYVLKVCWWILPKRGDSPHTAFFLEEEEETPHFLDDGNRTRRSINNGTLRDIIQQRLFFVSINHIICVEILFFGPSIIGTGYIMASVDRSSSIVIDRRPPVPSLRKIVDLIRFDSIWLDRSRFASIEVDRPHRGSSRRKERKGAEKEENV